MRRSLKIFSYFTAFLVHFSFLHPIPLDIGCMSLLLHGRGSIEKNWVSSLLILILFILCRLFTCSRRYRQWGWRCRLRDVAVLSPSIPSLFHQLLEVGCVPGTGLNSGGQQQKKAWCPTPNTPHSCGKRKGKNGHLVWCMGPPWGPLPDQVDKTFLRAFPAELPRLVKSNQSTWAVADELTGSALAFPHLCRVEMSAQRLISNRTSQQSASNSDYTWEYEYYEIGPVSFEGLKAHKCKSYPILHCEHNMNLS